MTSKGPTVYQTSYGLLRETLGGVLEAVVESGPRTEVGTGSVRWRACAALYWLVQGHPVDRRGRCRSCRRPGAVLGRARRCQVRVAACYWLHQPDETLLLDLLTRELDQHPAPSAGAGERAERSGSGHPAPAAGPDTTDVLPRIDLDQHAPPPQAPGSHRRPLPGGGCPPAGWSGPDHGGAGKHRARRSPPEDPPAAPLRHHGADPEHGHREVRLLPDPGGWPVPVPWPGPRWQPVGAVSTGTVR